MKVLVTALAAEARPLIRHFKLRKDDCPGGIPSYRSEDTCLVISGTSKVKAAIATTWILSQTPGMEDSVALNFGFCGCRDRTEPVGTLFLINRIRDVATGRTYYPDILFRHDLMESSVSTHDRPVREERSDGTGTPLVDMEASGFFEAAARFLPPERIICAKLVSDHLEEGRLSARGLERLIEARTAELEQIIEGAGRLRVRAFRFTGADRRILENLRDSLSLTVTQCHQLDDWARGYCIRNETQLASIGSQLPKEARTKRERNRTFLDLGEVLSR